MIVSVKHRCSDFNSYRSARVKSLFNAENGCNWEKDVEIPIEGMNWKIGLVVGASGSGKTSIGKAMFGEPIHDLYDGWETNKPIVESILPNGDFNTVTAAYFYSYGKFTMGTDNIRSGGSTGFADPNQVMPILSSCKGRVLKATLALRGAAVWNNSVTFPCTYRCELWKVGFSNEGTKLGDINFSIQSGNIGFYTTSVATNYQGSVMLNIPVEDGDMLAIKWVPVTTPAASGIVGMKNAIVTLTII